MLTNEALSRKWQSVATWGHTTRREGEGEGGREELEILVVGAQKSRKPVKRGE